MPELGWDSVAIGTPVPVLKKGAGDYENQVSRDADPQPGSEYNLPTE